MCHRVIVILKCCSFTCFVKLHVENIYFDAENAPQKRSLQVCSQCKCRKRISKTHLKNAAYKSANIVDA